MSSVGVQQRHNCAVAFGFIYYFGSRRIMSLIATKPVDSATMS